VKGSGFERPGSEADGREKIGVSGRSPDRKKLQLRFTFLVALASCGGVAPPPREPTIAETSPPPPKGTLAITSMNVLPSDMSGVDYVTVGTNWPGTTDEIASILYGEAYRRRSLWDQLISMMPDPDEASRCGLSIRCEDPDHRRMALAQPHLLSGYCLVTTECQGQSTVREAGYDLVVREDKVRALSLWEIVGWDPSPEWAAACKRVLSHDASTASDASLQERCAALPKGSPTTEMDFYMTSDVLVVHLGADDLRMPWKDLRGAVSEEWIHEASRLMPLIEPWAK
jgi:hypothetical protein